MLFGKRTIDISGEPLGSSGPGFGRVASVRSTGLNFHPLGSGYDSQQNGTTIIIQEVGMTTPV